MKVKIVNKLTDKGYPVHSKKYKAAHRAASILEKKKYPKGYEKLKKLERKMYRHSLMGKSTKRGKIEIAKKYKPFKKEITLHEQVEHYKMEHKRNKK